jgi:hypothetical protein
VALWYRHWLELRFPALILLLVVVFSVYSFDRELSQLTARLESTGRLPAAGARWFRPLAETLPPREVITLIAHADSLVMLVWATAFLLSGNGFGVPFGSGSRSRGTASGAIQYTLSLPVTRTTLVLTRVAAGGAGALLLLALASAGNAAVLSSRGLPLLPGPMVAIAGVGLLASLFWIAAAAMLVMILGQGWGFGASVVGIMFSIALFVPAMGSAAAQEGMRFFFLSLGAVVTAGVVYLSTEIANHEEV